MTEAARVFGPTPQGVPEMVPSPLWSFDMRLAIAPIGRAAAAWLFTGIAVLAAPHGAPRYVGTFTGEPERDSYGYADLETPQEVLCIIGPRQYFGIVTGDPEQDTYGYLTAMVPGTSCPTNIARQS